MCGMAGIFSYYVDAPRLEREELMHMRESMATRGPDGEGFWTSDRRDIGLVHLAPGKQMPAKQAMVQAPANPLPEHIVHRPKTGFSVPVQQWIEAAGEVGWNQRGLRGWAKNVYAMNLLK